MATSLQDFKILLELTEPLSDADRKARIKDYKQKFNSPIFYQVLHRYYLEHGLLWMLNCSFINMILKEISELFNRPSLAVISKLDFLPV